MHAQKFGVGIRGSYIVFTRGGHRWDTLAGRATPPCHPATSAQGAPDAQELTAVLLGLDDGWEVHRAGCVDLDRVRSRALASSSVTGGFGSREEFIQYLRDLRPDAGQWPPGFTAAAVVTRFTSCVTLT